MSRRSRFKAVVGAAVVAALAGVGGSAAVTTPPITVAIGKAAAITATPTKGVTAGGTIKCQRGHHYRIVAALVQKMGGGYASASYPPQHTQKTCSGPTTGDKWALTLETKSGTLKAGPAQLCVLATTQLKSQGATGLAQSCNLVTLAAPK